MNTRMKHDSNILEGNGIILELDKLSEEGYYLERQSDGVLRPSADPFPKAELVLRFLDGFLRPELDTFELKRHAGSGPTIAKLPGTRPWWQANLTLPRPGKCWDSALHFMCIGRTPEEALGRLLFHAKERLSELEPWPPERPAIPPEPMIPNATVAADFADRAFGGPGPDPAASRCRQIVRQHSKTLKFKFSDPATPEPSARWNYLGEIERVVGKTGVEWWTCEEKPQKWETREKAALSLQVRHTLRNQR